MTGSFTITPAGTVRLEDNLADLEPRAHIYVSAGVTNLPLAFALSTTALANVRTPKRKSCSRRVMVFRRTASTRLASIRFRVNDRRVTAM